MSYFINANTVNQPRQTFNERKKDIEYHFNVVEKQKSAHERCIQYVNELYVNPNPQPNHIIHYVRIP